MNGEPYPIWYFWNRGSSRCSTASEQGILTRVVSKPCCWRSPGGAAGMGEGALLGIIGAGESCCNDAGMAEPALLGMR